MKHLSSLFFLALLFLFLVSCSHDPVANIDTPDTEARVVRTIELNNFNDLDAEDPYLDSDGYLLGF